MTVFRWSILFLACLVVWADTVTYGYDEAGRLIRVGYGSGKTITYTYDRAGNLLRRLVSTTRPGPTPAATAAGVVNAASFLGGAVAPGEIVTLFGTGIGRQPWSAWS
jgi:YD repeat-containing protein